MLLKTLMFDLGNVIIFFDNDRMCRQMGEVTGLTPERIQEIATSEGVQIAYEHGHIATDEMVRLFQQASPQPFAKEDLLNAFCDIFTPNDSLIEALPRLKAKGLRLIIVSNTNEAHIAWGQARQTFFQHFDYAVFSHEIKAMKPQTAFYKHALAFAQCEPQEALFIDDLAVNCEGAQACGLHSHQFRRTDLLFDELRRLGIDPL